MSNSIKFIKFKRNWTSQPGAAFLPRVRLVFSHDPIEMSHRFKRRISAASNLIHTLCKCLSMRKFSPAKEKEGTWLFSSKVTPRKYVLWGAIQYFAGQRYTLAKLQNACNFYIVITASLVDSEKDTKLRAHTVNLAFKLRSFVG